MNKYPITFYDIFDGTMGFIVETDAEDVAVVMALVGEKEFPCCGIVSEGRQLCCVVRIEGQRSVRISVGEKFELITDSNDKI